jgi:hypothetical protein
LQAPAPHRLALFMSTEFDVQIRLLKDEIDQALLRFSIDPAPGPGLLDLIRDHSTGILLLVRLGALSGPEDNDGEGFERALCVVHAVEVAAQFARDNPRALAIEALRRARERLDELEVPAAVGGPEGRVDARA